jgi:hypothetical protein
MRSALPAIDDSLHGGIPSNRLRAPSLRGQETENIVMHGRTRTGTRDTRWYLQREGGKEDVRGHTPVQGLRRRCSSQKSTRRELENQVMDTNVNNDMDTKVIPNQAYIFRVLVLEASF